MNSNYPGFVKAFLLTTAIACGLVIVINIWVDPWRYLHDSTLASWEGDGRLQNPGILKQKQLNTIVLGTSMTQNFDVNQLQAMYGGEAAILSISAGTGREQSMSARLALRQQSELRHLVWGIHPGSFSVAPNAVKRGAFPEYMYDESWQNDIFYLFNISTLEKSMADLRDSGGAPENSWKSLQNWHGRYPYGCPHALKLQLERRGLPSPADDWLGDKDDIRDNVRDNLYAVVAANPNVQFSLIFPPFSALYWSVLSENQPKRYQAYRTTLREVVRQLGTEPNVEIFDFTRMSTVTRDLSHYRDLTHFSSEISARILTNLEAGRHRVQLEDLASVASDETLLLDRNYSQEIDACLKQTAKTEL